MAKVLNSLTLNGEKYDCFVDPEARETAANGITAITCSGDVGIDIETPCGAHHQSGPITASGLTEAAQEELLGKFDAQLGGAVDRALSEAKASGEFDGEPGYTPVKGTDYYTEEDKAEMVSAVIDALPMYGGETE